MYIGLALNLLTSQASAEVTTSVWILAFNSWDDFGAWLDIAIWND
jgi:hypothetical protein